MVTLAGFPPRHAPPLARRAIIERRSLPRLSPGYFFDGSDRENEEDRMEFLLD